jgi:heme/copper-type cytochrome/quinol oxidase subunit 3
MGFVSVLIAALAGFAVGAAWYMTLAKQWVAASGVTVDENGRPEGSSPMPFVISGICMLLVAGMMRHMFAMAGIDGAAKGLVSGIGIGLFFIAPWIAMNVAYAMRPRALAIIDGGYAVVGCGIIGLVLGIF